MYLGSSIDDSKLLDLTTEKIVIKNDIDVPDLTCNLKKLEFQDDQVIVNYSIIEKVKDLINGSMSEFSVANTDLRYKLERKLKNIRKEKSDKNDLTEEELPVTTLQILHNISSYMQKHTSTFYKKSLEIQYRSFYVQKASLDILVQNRAQLESIVKNTGLPESIKSYHTRSAYKDFMNLYRRERMRQLLNSPLVKKIDKAMFDIVDKNPFVISLKKTIMDKVNKYAPKYIQDIINEPMPETPEERQAKLEDSVITVIPNILVDILNSIRNIGGIRVDGSLNTKKQKEVSLDQYTKNTTLQQGASSIDLASTLLSENGILGGVIGGFGFLKGSGKKDKVLTETKVNEVKDKLSDKFANILEKSNLSNLAGLDKTKVNWVDVIKNNKLTEMVNKTGILKDIKLPNDIQKEDIKKVTEQLKNIKDSDFIQPLKTKGVDTLNKLKEDNKDIFSKIDNLKTKIDNKEEIGVNDVLDILNIQDTIKNFNLNDLKNLLIDKTKNSKNPVVNYYKNVLMTEAKILGKLFGVGKGIGKLGYKIPFVKKRVDKAKGLYETIKDKVQNKKELSDIVNNITGSLDSFLNKKDVKDTEEKVEKSIDEFLDKQVNKQTSNKLNDVVQKANELKDNVSKSVNINMFNTIKEDKEEERRSGHWKDRLASFNKKKEENKPTKDDKNKKGGLSELLGPLKALGLAVAGLGAMVKPIANLFMGKGLGSIASTIGSMLLGGKLGKTIGGLAKLVGGTAGVAVKAGSSILKTAGAAGSAILASSPLLGKGANYVKKVVGVEGKILGKAAGVASSVGGAAVKGVFKKPSGNSKIAMIKDKILGTVDKLKSTAVKKLGKNAGAKIVKTLVTKVAARFVPFAGAALLAYDAYNIYKYIQEGMSLESAISKGLLGFDLFSDDDVPVDENGVPIKPDEKKTDDKEKDKINTSDIGKHLKEANNYLFMLKHSLASYKSGNLDVARLPQRSEVTTLKGKIRKLDDLKDKDEINKEEYNQCIKVYSEAKVVLDEIILIKNTELANRVNSAKSLPVSKEPVEPISPPVQHTVYRTDDTKDHIRNTISPMLVDSSPNYKNNIQDTPQPSYKIRSATDDIRSSTTETIRSTTTPSKNITPVNQPSYEPSIDNTPKNVNPPKIDTKHTTSSIKPKVKISSAKKDVISTIEQVAHNINVDPEIMKAIAATESGFNPNAQAKTSSAKGLFQILNGTWKALLKKYGDKYGVSPTDSPFDPVANSTLGGLYIKDNISKIAPIKPDINATDAYMGHFLGTGGARSFFRMMNKDPNQYFADAMPKAAAANTSIAYVKANPNNPRTLTDVYNLMGNKIKKNAIAYGLDVKDENLLSNPKPIKPIAKPNIASTGTLPDTSPNKVSSQQLSKASDKVSDIEPSNKQPQNIFDAPMVVVRDHSVQDPQPIAKVHKASVNIDQQPKMPTVTQDIKPSIPYVDIDRVKPKYDFSSISDVPPRPHTQPRHATQHVDHMGSMVRNTTSEVHINSDHRLVNTMSNMDKTLLQNLQVTKSIDNTLKEILSVNIKLLDGITGMSNSLAVKPDNPIQGVINPLHVGVNNELPNPPMNLKRNLS